MESNFYTPMAYAITVVGGLAALGYYRPDILRQWVPGPVRDATQRNTATGLFADSGSEGAKRRKRDERRAQRPKAVSTIDRPSPPLSSTHEDDGVAENEDKTWATRLNQARQGTNLAAPARASTMSKTVKQRNANNRAADISAGSSNGADADDDATPATSPILNGFHVEPSGSNVKDMLEPALSGPSILKVTEPTKPAFEKPKKAKVEQKQETKKDRQNRRKAEEKKAQREADEKERKLLEERQRRTAREARGEPAKNGLGIGSAPVNNAWQASNFVSAAPLPNPGANEQLLDTFAADTTSSGSTAPTSVSDSPVQGQGEWWKKEARSEQEQLAVLTETDESAWNTVSSKKKKKGSQNGGPVQPVDFA